MLINERVVTGFIILFFIFLVTPEVVHYSHERLGFIGYGVAPLLAIVLTEVVVWLRARIRRRQKPDF